MDGNAIKTEKALVKRRRTRKRKRYDRGRELENYPPNIH